jgi:hypothetical protein
MAPAETAAGQKTVVPLVTDHELARTTAASIGERKQQ